MKTDRGYKYVCTINFKSGMFGGINCNQNNNQKSSEIGGVYMLATIIGLVGHMVVDIIVAVINDNE